MKAPFDSDKIHQLISEIVDKTFVTDDEEEPYVSITHRRSTNFLLLLHRHRFLPFFRDVLPYNVLDFPFLRFLQVYNANENVNLCQRISKEIRDSLKTWRQLMRWVLS